MKKYTFSEIVKRSFANKYLKWGLLLDDAVIDSVGAHVINKDEWEIRFIEASDSKGAYLEFYAISSTYPDEHFKLYQDGLIVTCDTIAEGYSYNESLPGNKETQREAYIKNNRKVYDYLKDTGLYRR